MFLIIPRNEALKRKRKPHGEKDFVALTKHFVSIASANQTCCADNFTGRGNKRICCCVTLY